jgi:transposase
VVSNLETGEPPWFGRERKKETLDEFFQKQLSAFQRSAIRAACVDMHEPYRLSLEQWVPQCRLIYDKFHVMKHANEAVAEVRRVEFFRKGGAARELIKGKHWLLLTRWVHLNTNKKRQLNQLFALNRRVMKANLLKESLDRLWAYTYEGAMLRYLQSWIDQLRWQRAIEMLMDLHRATRQSGSPARRFDLQAEMLKAHCVVPIHRPLKLQAENEIQVLIPPHITPCPLWATRVAPPYR